MSISVVQTAGVGQTSGTTLTTTFGGTATANNLLVAGIFHKSDTAPTNPTGFTTAISVLNATNNDTLRIAYKVSAGTETTIQWTGIDSDSGGGRSYEVSGLATSSVLDKTGYKDFNATGVTSVQCDGTSGIGTTTSDNEFIVAMAGVRLDVSSPSFDGSFINATADVSGGNTASIVAGNRIISAAGTYSTTASWTGSGAAMACMAAFTDGGGGGGGPTIHPMTALGVGA